MALFYVCAIRLHYLLRMHGCGLLLASDVPSVCVCVHVQHSVVLYAYCVRLVIISEDHLFVCTKSGSVCWVCEK